MRTPATQEARDNGLAVCKVWPERLLRADDFPTDDAAVPHERYIPHNDAARIVAEGR